MILGNVVPNRKLPERLREKNQITSTFFCTIWQQMNQEDCNNLAWWSWEDGQPGGIWEAWLTHITSCSCSSLQGFVLLVPLLDIHRASDIPFIKNPPQTPKVGGWGGSNVLLNICTEPRLCHMITDLVPFPTKLSTSWVSYDLAQCLWCRSNQLKLTEGILRWTRPYIILSTPWRSLSFETPFNSLFSLLYYKEKVATTSMNGRVRRLSQVSFFIYSFIQEIYAEYLSGVRCEIWTEEKR